MDELFNNIALIHTTEMGLERIKRNLKLDSNCDIVNYCISLVLDKNSKIELNGKNYYVYNQNIVITINKYSYTIITAHLIKK